MVIGIYGASGFGREVLPLVRQSVRSAGNIYFIDDASEERILNGVEVLSWDQFLEIKDSDMRVILAIADANVRKSLAVKCEAAGVQVDSVIAENSIIMDEVDIGKGAVICPFVTLTSNIKIGQSFHANIYSYVAHDCVIGDYVTLAPRVMCNGNVVVEDYAYIGTGAIIKQGTPDKPTVIGAGAIVGMGAVVTKSVAPGSVVVGNPAKVLER